MNDKEKIVEKTEVVDTEINLDDILTDSIILPDDKKPNVLSKREEEITNEDLEIDENKEETIEDIVDEVVEDKIKDTPKPSNFTGIAKKLIEKKVILPFEDDKVIDDYTEDEIRLVRIKFISEMANLYYI